MWISRAGQAHTSLHTRSGQSTREGQLIAQRGVLDVGCGAGRHSLYLQGKGFDVTGIDISPLAIKVCRLRGLHKVKNMSIAEVGKFGPNSFDTIIMMGNNFGLFGSRDGAKSLLKRSLNITAIQGLINCRKQRPIQDR